MIKKLKESLQDDEFTVNLTEFADGWSVGDYAVAFMNLEDEYKRKGYENIDIQKFYISNGGKLYANIKCTAGKRSYLVHCNIVDKKGNTKLQYVSVEARDSDEAYDIYERDYIGKWANKNLGYKYGDIISVE